MIYISIVSSNFKFVYLINQILSNIKDLRIEHVLPSEKIPEHTDIVITTQSEKIHINFAKTFVPKAFNKNYIYSNILLLANNKKRFHQVNIGIDPGKRTGFAVIGDGQILQTAEYEVPIEVVKAVIEAFFNIETDHFYIKIGDKGGQIGDEIRERLFKIFSHKTVISVVSEANTSKKILKQFSKNINSAILIAQK